MWLLKFPEEQRAPMASQELHVAAFDHVNLQIPSDGVDDALAFYRDTLGFSVEDLAAYREGERPIFTFRLTDTAVIHVRPTDQFEAPSDRNFGHFAIVFDASIDAIRSRLAEAAVPIERDGNPKGATGSNPAVYVRDPFGYLLELKQAR